MQEPEQKLKLSTSNIIALTDAEWLEAISGGFKVEGGMHKARISTKDEEIKNKLNEIRFERDLLLSKSDWTQLNDVNLSKKEIEDWARYRQELRDMTDNITELTTVTFPKKPN